MNIYIPKLASPVETNAASELSTYLEKVFSCAFPILPEDTASPSPAIYVGFTDYAAAHNIAVTGGKNELDGAEGWIIRAVNDSLVITGGRCNTDRGILYAVYHYLEDVLGVRFWNAVEEYIPALEAFTIDPALDLSGEPELIMRNPYAGSCFGNDLLTCIRHRVNYSRYIPNEWGGRVDCSPRGHAHTTIGILPRGDLFSQHPDWFAWSESMQRRLPYGQYCMNNPELIEAFEKAFIADIGRIYAEFDAKGEARPHHFHISLDDTAFDCECPLCKERMEKSGYTGNVLRFVNHMAKAAEKVYPGILVETLAYWTYMDPPLDDTLPESNVIIRLADLDIDILHSLNHPNNAHGLKVLQKWSEICQKSGAPLYVWDYNVIYSSTFSPNVSRTAENFRVYAENGVTANYTEHEEDMLSDFWGLKRWLLYHLMEDPHADADALIADYMDKYYGAAAPFLTKWLELEEAATRESPVYMCCVQNFCKADHIPYELYVEGCRLFDEAEAAVEYDEVLTRRVRQARAALDLSICLRYDTLLYMAAHRGVTFPIARETAALRYALTVHQTLDQARAYQKDHPEFRLPRWEGMRPLPQWTVPYTPAALPEQFAGSDTLQVPMNDYVILISQPMGIVHWKDEESLSGYAGVLNLEIAPEYIRDEAHIISRDDPGHQFTMSLRHRGVLTRRQFSLEDLHPDEYALYHILDIDDLGEDSNTLFRMIHSCVSLHLSGFAQALPTGKVSVWLRMKFTGKAYGGDPSKPDAVWFDRMYLVPRD